MKLILSILLLASISFADTFEDGLKAYKSGDYKKALSVWTPLANKGNASAQYNLGVMYEKGIGVDQDYKEVAKWYKLSAKQGHALAQYNLGTMYYKGRGIEVNKTESYNLWKASSKQGHQNSKVSLEILCKETPSVCK